MASGHMNRVKRPDTWLHRPMLQNVKKVLANPEPSTHDPWRGEWPPADVTARACRRRVVADGLHGQSSSTTSIVPSFHGRREGTGDLEPIAQVIVFCHRDI